LGGITAALSIANQGFEVALIERSEKLGGNMNGLYHTLDGSSVPAFLQNLKDQIDDHPLVKVYLNAELKKIDGYIGNYKSIFEYKGEEKEFKHGIIIITTGGNASKPKEYLYEDHKNVITQRELEHDLEENEKDYKKVKSAVFIQCVGSRDEDHPYCSRICCAQAVKNAMRLKRLNPKMDVSVLYNHICYSLYSRMSPG